jgi:hypothetical protein
MFRAADRVIRVMPVNDGGLARNVAFPIWEGSGFVSGDTGTDRDAPAGGEPLV